jgi:hypothetical protein
MLPELPPYTFCAYKDKTNIDTAASFSILEIIASKTSLHAAR